MELGKESTTTTFLDQYNPYYILDLTLTLINETSLCTKCKP